MNIDIERLTKLDELVLKSGSHSSNEDGLCTMEAVSWLAGEEHSDHPKCACLVIAAFVRRFNDRLKSDDERTSLLRPLVPVLIGTKSTSAVMSQRGYMSADWSVRTMLPMLFRALGLEAEARTCEELPRLTNNSSSLRARDVVRGVRDRIRTAAYAAAADADAAYAAYAAAADAAAAAVDAADAAAYAADAAADAAAYAAADAADAAAAAYAAADAAYAAAYAAYAKRQQLLEARTSINESAVQLIRRMCAVTE